MAKYYNADTLLEFVKNNTPTIDGQTTMKCVERAIKEAPTADVVEVVRCKDCKHYCLSDFRKPEEHRWCEQICNGDYYPEPTDFCSYGERTIKMTGGRTSEQE